MRALIVTVASLAVIALAALAASAAPADAAPLRCSAGGDWNPVEASDVIVGGRITSWERRADIGDRGAVGAVQLHMEIAHVWKGAVRPGEAIVDPASYLLAPGPDVWAGASGACGALDHDPTGMYAVFGLTRSQDGYLRTNRLTTFWLQPEPYDPAALSSPERRIFRLPSLGSQAAVGRNPTLLFCAAAMLLAGCTTMGIARRIGRS
jgi:hypothetical protein